MDSYFAGPAGGGTCAGFDFAGGPGWDLFFAGQVKGYNFASFYMVMVMTTPSSCRRGLTILLVRGHLPSARRGFNYCWLGDGGAPPLAAAVRLLRPGSVQLGTPARAAAAPAGRAILQRSPEREVS